MSIELFICLLIIVSLILIFSIFNYKKLVLFINKETTLKNDNIVDKPNKIDNLTLLNMPNRAAVKRKPNDIPNNYLLKSEIVGSMDKTDLLSNIDSSSLFDDIHTNPFN